MDDHPSQQQDVTITAENRKVLDFIESCFNGILQQIKVRPYGKPVIALKRIVAVKPSYDETDSTRLKWNIQDREVRYSFPGKNKDEAWRFACVGRILSEIYTAIKQGVTVTKRDIYYHDPTLFKQQETVDRYIDDIAHTCGVTRKDLNVTAAAKGLVAGLHRDRQTSIIHAHWDSTAFLGIRHLNWILVVEKEATFNTLIETGLHKHPIIGPGLIVTAKGYPDLATRHFLRLLLVHVGSSIPIFGLFDWDPDGIQILKCYLYGSKNSAREHECNVPEMRWIGLKAEDFVSLRYADETSMRLTARDRASAASMLASEEWRDGVGNVLPGLKEAVAELRRMLMLNRKAEIQILDERDGGLGEWLKRRLSQRS